MYYGKTKWYTNIKVDVIFRKYISIMLCKVICFNTWSFSLDEISAWINVGFLYKFFWYKLQPDFFAIYATLAYFLGWKNLFEEPFTKKKEKEKMFHLNYFFYDAYEVARVWWTRRGVISFCARPLEIFRYCSFPNLLERLIFITLLRHLRMHKTG